MCGPSLDPKKLNVKPFKTLREIWTCLNFKWYQEILWLLRCVKMVIWLWKGMSYFLEMHTQVCGTKMTWCLGFTLKQFVKKWKRKKEEAEEGEEEDNNNRDDEDGEREKCGINHSYNKIKFS